MEEDAELEEGEAKEPLDPDTDFSYLDKKLQLLLGDCQKEFQGGNLSTEKLGSKYGGYGTFLPTHARVPSLLAEPHPVPPAAEPVRTAEAQAPVEPVKRVAGNATQQITVKENGAAGSTQVGPKVKLKFKLRKEDVEEAQRKALYNGLCLDHSSSASLDDEDTYSQSNVESPEPSPMSMIQIMTSHRLEGGLLSPLCDSAFDLVDMKETMQKPRLNSVTQFTGSKAELGSPVGPGLDYKKGKGWDKEKTSLVEAKKAGDSITDADGGKRSRRDSDADRKSVKEPAGQWLPKSVKADISKAEQQDLADVVGGEAFGKDDYDSEREHPKNSRKQQDVGRSIGGNGQKEKDGVDAKGAGKLNSSKNRDSKEVSRNKVTITKIQVRKDYEPTRLVESDKETSDKVGSLVEGRKHLKEDMKDGAVKMKEGPKEGVKENQRKDVAGDIKAKELHKDGMKSVGISGGTTKKSNSNVSNRKAGTTEQKGAKTVQDRRLSMKELDRERVNIPEPVAIKEEEKAPTKVESALAAVVAPMPVQLDNWVACDKCEQWRLLMPHVNPDLLPKKWRCKMMDWLPGMNNCKFREEETTAAVYQKLGYQNPALVLAGVGVPLPLATTAMAVAPVPQQLQAPVADPVSEKWADQTETKKTASLSKKGVARKSVPTGVKVAANKGAEGAIKSKNLSDVGLDSSADGAAVLTEKHKQRAKEKNKRIRPPEGEDSHIKKKVLQEQEHNVYLSQWEKEPMDIEPSRAGREREAYLPPEGEGTVLSAKRKKSGAFGDMDETLNFKKSKGSRAKLQVDETQVPSEDDLDGTDKRYIVQKPKRDTLIHKSRETQHPNLVDKDMQHINSVLRDIESGNEKQRREEKEQTRMFTEQRRLKTSQLEKHRRSKEEDSDSEQRIHKRHKDSDVHSERHNPVIKPKTPHFVNEDHNRSTSSKISTSSLGSSGVGLKGAGSPVESTVSSSPLRGMNGNKEVRNSRDPGNPPSSADMGMHQQSCSPGPKHVRNASRGSSWDEGEFRQGGVSQNATRSRKYESSEARDDEWYNDEDRGADHGHTFVQHGERQAHGSREKDEMDEHHRRRHNRDRDNDRGRLGARDNDHIDEEDRYLRERSIRDDRGRSRETGLDKPGGRSWDDNRKQEGVNHVLNKDDAAPVSVQGHGPKDGGFSKDPSREGDRTVSNSRKESGLIAVGPSDTMINKRLVVSSNARVLGERGDALKREDLEVGVVKPSVGEGVAGSPAKKEYAQAQHLANVAIKDATSLKHSADRLKGSAGNDCESTNLYLQAALKFLQAAAMLEPIYAESARQGEVTQSMTLYIDTAKLCDFCAITYKRSGDLRAVALAYTCAAVARVRVVMAKQACFARDTGEFRNAMQLDSGPHHASNGESPSSSSASDVDNLNNQQTSILGNKVPMSKPAIVSPQVISGAGAGTAFIIPGRLRPVPTRFLRDAIDMSALLDSWQKAAEATAKAEASRDTRGMAAVKQVGELGGFGDIDGVVRLVRVAMEAIGH